LQIRFAHAKSGQVFLWRQILISEQKIHPKKYNLYGKLMRQNPFVSGEGLGQLVTPEQAKTARRLFVYKCTSACGPFYLSAIATRARKLYRKLSKRICVSYFIIIIHQQDVANHSSLHKNLWPKVSGQNLVMKD